MGMSLNKAKAVAKDPESYSTEELDDALTVIVEDDRLTEKQVTRLQAAIDPVLRARLDERAATCKHPAERQSSDLETNEVLCTDCGYLRDLMPWDEWAKLPAQAHLTPMADDPAVGRPSAKDGA